MVRETSSKNTSKAEEELVRFIQSLFPEAAPSNAVIPPYHLDCYVPEKQIAVEFNGIYWHSEKIRSDKNYHFNKWKACKDKGIQLIQIWEDDWNQNPDLVKSMLQHKLGKTPGERIFARNTQIITPTPQQTERFLATNHIQGAVAGSIRVGLQEGLQLVAVMVLKKEGDSLNLLRYATSGAVVGGFTKLLRYVEKTVHPTSIYTFSDNTVSDGGLYEKNGFTIASRLPPDYMYVVKNRRRHKFGYRLKRFRNDPELQYVDGYTEKQLAELNGLVRIWDAGKTKWVKHVHANKEVIMTGKGSEEASEAGKKLSYSDSKKEKSKASKTLNDHKKKSR